MKLLPLILPVATLAICLASGIAEAQSCPACQESRLPAGNPGLTRGQSLEGGTWFVQPAIRYSDYIDKQGVHHSNTSTLLSLSAQFTDQFNLSMTLPYHFLTIDGE